jgi:hypothetical protein
MPNRKGKLYLFEATALRDEYDEKIELIEQLLGSQDSDHHFMRNDDEDKEPVSEFDIPDFQQRLKKLQTKRVKLNQAIQEANFKYKIDFGSEKISLSEALEVRKNLLAKKAIAARQVKEAAYKRIIHKEERDVIRKGRYSFDESYKQYLDILASVKDLINKIHVKNHESVAQFKEE